jgi:hypothetical protein
LCGQTSQSDILDPDLTGETECNSINRVGTGGAGMLRAIVDEVIE